MMTRRRFILTTAGVLVPALPRVAVAQGPFVAMRPKTTKPPFGSVQINWGHPLARDLRLCVLFNEGAGLPRDLLWHGPATQSGTMSWLTNSSGPGVAAGGTTSDFFSFGSLVDLTGIGTLSVTAIATPVGMARGDFVCHWGAAGSRHFNLLQGVTASTFQFFGSTDGSNSTGSNTISFSVGQTYRLTGVADGTDIRLYQNGVAGTPVAVGTLYGGATNTVNVGANDNSGSTTQVTLAYIHARPLSASECAWLHAEPYAFLSSVPAVTYVFMRTPAAPAEPGGGGITPLRSLLGVGQ